MGKTITYKCTRCDKRFELSELNTRQVPIGYTGLCVTSPTLTFLYTVRCPHCKRAPADLDSIAKTFIPNYEIRYVTNVTSPKRLENEDI